MDPLMGNSTYTLVLTQFASVLDGVPTPQVWAFMIKNTCATENKLGFIEQ